MNALTVLREKELARFALPRDELLIVRAVQYAKGGLRLDLRKYYTTAQGELKPTGKGAGLRPEWIPDLRKALDAFEAEHATHG